MIPLLEGETVTYHGATTRSTTSRSSRARRTGPRSGSAAARSWPIPSRPTCRASSSRSRRECMRTDGWIPRPTCPPDEIARDWRELQDYYREHGRDPRECVVAHENFLHLVLTNDPAKAREEQHAAFLRVMSTERGPEYLETVYLFGTPDEVIASLQARIDAGVEYFMLHTMTPDPAQLQTWIDEIIPNLRFPVARAARHDSARRPDRQAAQAAPLGGDAQRRLRRRRHRRPLRAGIELEPDDVAGIRRAGARAGVAGNAGHRAVQEGGGRRCVDEVEPDAAAIGAVNSVRQDARRPAGGFQHGRAGLSGRRDAGARPAAAGLDVVVAGAGGAAHAVVFALPQAGVRRLTVANRTTARRTVVGDAGDRARQRRLRCCRPIGRPGGQRDHRRHDRTRHDHPGRSAARHTRPFSTSSTSRPRRPCWPPLAPAACARPTARRCSSQQAAIAFERWTGVGGMADVMREAVAPLFADPARAPDRCSWPSVAAGCRRCEIGAVYTIGLNYRDPCRPGCRRTRAAAGLRQGVVVADRAWIDRHMGPQRSQRTSTASASWASWSAPAPPCSATRSSTTSPRATSGWTATSGCSASRCPASVRSGPEIVPATRARPGRSAPGLHDQRRGRPGRPDAHGCASRSSRSSTTWVATSDCRPAT